MKARTEYRYYNSILWGDAYNPRTGEGYNAKTQAHHFMASNDQAAFRIASRSAKDKAELGLSILQKRNVDGVWAWCKGRVIA